MSDIIPYDPSAQLQKRGGDKSLYPLPSTADNGSRLCVRVNIPNIPAHRQAFIGAIYNLTRWYSWGRDEAHSAKAIAAVWRDVFNDMMEHFYDNCEDCPPEDKCIDYPTDSGVLSYFPTSPFTEPETIPNQFYNKPPFYIYQGDVITDITVPSANPLDLPYLAQTELPRIRINVTGDKLVRIHLLSVIQGGYATIMQDDNVLTTNWVDLTRASLLDFQAILQAIQEGLQIGSLSGILYEEVITEVKFETTGNHHIDIVFWPKFNSEVIIGFGGGLRKVEICGNEICDMTFELRQNPDNSCLIEQRLTPNGDWLPAFNLGACMTNNCCNENPPPSRITVEGTFQIYNGTTWVDAPEQDPRNNITQLPPIATGNVSDDKCAAANSAVAFLQQMQADVLAKRQANATHAQIAEAIIGILIVAGIIATGGAFALLGGLLAVLVTNASATDFENAFTASVWSDLLCRIVCALDDNLAISTEQWSALKAQVKADHPGIAGDFLSQTLNTMGVLGLQNATRLGMNAGLSCASCEVCEEDYVTWDFRIEQFGVAAIPYEADPANHVPEIPAGTWVSGSGFESYYQADYYQTYDGDFLEIQLPNDIRLQAVTFVAWWYAGVDGGFRPSIPFSEQGSVDGAEFSTAYAHYMNFAAPTDLRGKKLAISYLSGPNNHSRIVALRFLPS